MARTATAAADAVTTRYPELEIASIESSGLNPRTHWDAAADRELEESIRVDGMLEPIIVRPHPAKGNVYQIVAGERRFRAAGAVGLGQVPAIIRVVTDEKLLELALTENIQRRSMHPLDEANGFIARLEMGGCSPEALASSLGLSKRYITDRIRLKKLSAKATKGVESGRVSVSHAILLAKLDPKLQDKAIEDIADYGLDFEDDADGNKREPVLGPVQALKEWIANNVPLDPTSPDVQEEFPQLQEAFVDAAAKGATVTMLSDHRTPWQHKAKAADPMFADKWDECKKTDKAAQVGIVVKGRRRGERVYWKTHVEPVRSKPSASTAAGSGMSAAERKREQDRRKREKADADRRAEMARQWKTEKPKAIAAIKAHIDGLPSKALIGYVAKYQRLKPTSTAEGLLAAIAVERATISDATIESMNFYAKQFGFDVKQWFAGHLKSKAAPAKAAKKAKKR